MTRVAKENRSAEHPRSAPPSLNTILFHCSSENDPQHLQFSSLRGDAVNHVHSRNCTRLPAKDNCLFAFTKRRSESPRRRERERGRLFRDKSNNRGNGLWLIDEGASSCREGAIRCQEGTRCLASKFPRIPLQGEECSIWRFDWRESVNRLSWIKHSRIRRSGGELIRIHSSGVREDYKESFGKFERWKGTVIDWKNIWKSTSRFRSNFVLSYRENLFLIVALVFFFFLEKRNTFFWKKKRINRRESWCWCEESCSVIVVWLRDSPAFRWIVLKTRKQGGKKPANWMLQTVPRLPRPRLTLLSPRMTGEESLI